MGTVNIVICDDGKENMNHIRVHVEEYMKEHYIEASFFSTTSPKEILNCNTVFDMAFLDIQMPEIDGITLAKELKRRNKRIILFFVTAFEQYQDEAMDLNIFRFFEKPIDVGRLYSGLDKAMECIDNLYVDIYFEGDGRCIKLPVDSIKYIRRENRQNSVFTVEGTYRAGGDFNELINKLPNTFFYLVHKSFYVNLHYITEYSYKEIYIDDTRIAIATRKQSDFHKYWFNYVRRN